MSRGTYNTTCDLYYGVGSTLGPPGTMYAQGLPCRLVLQDGIVFGSQPYGSTMAWLTLDLPLPHTEVFTSPGSALYTADWDQADMVAVPSGAEPSWYALLGQTVTPRHGPYGSYGRVYLCDVLPVVPPSPPPPGVTVVAYQGAAAPGASSTDVGLPVNQPAAGILSVWVSGAAVPPTPSGWTATVANHTSSGGVYLCHFYKESDGSSDVTFVGSYAYSVLYADDMTPSGVANVGSGHTTSAGVAGSGPYPTGSVSHFAMASSGTSRPGQASFHTAIGTTSVPSVSGWLASCYCVPDGGSIASGSDWTWGAARYWVAGGFAAWPALT